MVVNVELWRRRFGEHLLLRGRSERTLEGYLLETRLFLGFLKERGVEAVSDIGRQDVDAYRLRLHHWRKPNGEPLTLSTQTAKMCAVLGFLSFLHEERFVLVNPGHGVKLPRVPDTLPRALLDEDQVLQLLQAPDTATPLGLRDRAILELLYSSAIRNTELRLLEVQDLDLHQLEARIHNGKGRKGRVVPVGEPAAAALTGYLRHGRPWLVRDPNTTVLFLNSWGRPLSCELLAELVRERAVSAGLPGRVTPHVLRHCCATHMLRRRAGLRHLQELLGHASADTTRRYTRVEISDLREVHRRCHPREA